MAIADLQRNLGTPRLTASDHAKLLTPVYGLTWNRNVITTATANEIARLFVRIRNSHPSERIRAVNDIFNRASEASNQLPSDLWEWKMLAGRLRLESTHGWPSLLAAASFLKGRGLANPAALAALPAEGLEFLGQTEGRAVIIRALWGIARCTFVPSDSSSCLVPQRQEFAMDHLVMEFQRRKAQFARSGKIRVRISPEIKQKQSSLHVGPMKKPANSPRPIFRHRRLAAFVPTRLRPTC